MKRLPGILACIALALLVEAAIPAGIQPVSAGNVKSRWSPGWDRHDVPLDFRHSFVRFNQPDGTKSLIVTYHLQTAQPNWIYRVGFHLFPAGSCPTSFGDLTPFNCFVATREGETRLVSGYTLGTITTDEFGNGNLSASVKGITPGTYDLEFDVAESDLIFCARVFQSPGPFGHTVTIVVH